MEARNRKPHRATPRRRRQATPVVRRGLSAVAAIDVQPKSPAAASDFDQGVVAPHLLEAWRSLMAENQELRAELEEARARISSLEKLVDEDPLMPVCNRRAFVRELSRMMALAGRYGLPGSVVYFDVNNLKQINDVHGHAAGDAALMQVARILVESVRATDVVGRLGGDELGVLLLRTDKILAEQKAGELAERVKTRPLSWNGQSVSLSVAFGVYAFLGNENAHDVLDAADREMYRRKSARRSRA